MRFFFAAKTYLRVYSQLFGQTCCTGFLGAYNNKIYSEVHTNILLSADKECHSCRIYYWSGKSYHWRWDPIRLWSPFQCPNCGTKRHRRHEQTSCPAILQLCFKCSHLSRWYPKSFGLRLRGYKTNLRSHRLDCQNLRSRQHRWDLLVCGENEVTGPRVKRETDGWNGYCPSNLPSTGMLHLPNIGECHFILL